jgi:site-specific recombinase XerD
MSPRELLKLTIIKIDGAYAPATIRAYKANFERFIVFCENLKTPALPAGSDIVATYIRDLADGRLTSASIRIAIASISAIHKLNQLNDPTTHPDVKIEMRRMHRKLGRESKQAEGINMRTLHRILANTDKSLICLRDKALLLTAYDGMCRRSELVSLNIEDISYTVDNSIKIKLRRSKTDQDGLGRWLHLSKESQAAINEWINEAKIQSGKIFRGINKFGEVTERLGPSQINRIFKKLARKSKLNPDIVKRISGHSMRVGAAQDMLNSGENLAKIMQRGRWSKTETVMRYIENSTLDLSKSGLKLF